MKKWIVSTALIAALLAGCSNNSTEENKGQAASNEKQVEEVKDDRIKVSLQQVKDKAVYSTVMQSSAENYNVYIVPVSSSIEIVEDSTAFSSAGDIVSEGVYSFFLEKVGEDFAYLQPDMAEKELIMNLTDLPFRTVNFNNYTFLDYAEIEVSIADMHEMWRVVEGELVPVTIDGEVGYSSFATARFIDNQYMQKSDYYNAEPVGWIYYTYEWNEEKGDFKLIDEREFLDDNWDEGDYYNTLRNENEHYTVPFARYDLLPTLKKLAAEGKIIEDGPALGMSLTEALSTYPKAIEGMGYFYSNGLTFDADEQVTGLYLDGAALLDTNTPEAFVQLLGPTDNEEYGGGSKAWHDLTYFIGNYSLTISDDLEGNIYSVNLYLTDD